MASGCLKGFLIVINVIVSILGVALLGVGIYLEVETDQVRPYLAVTGVNHAAFGAVLIGDGLFVILIGMIGIYGVVTKKRSYLLFYIILLLTVFIVLVAAAGVLYGYRHKLSTSISTGMRASLSKYNSSATDTDGWNKVQTLLKCCGSHNYTDYYTVAPSWTLTTELPSSCCPEGNVTTAVCPPASAYKIGCFQGTLDALMHHWYTWGGAAIAIAVGLLFSVVMAAIYRCQMSAYETV